MSRVFLTIRKLRAEVGCNVVRLFPCIGGVLLNTLRPAGRTVRAQLAMDYETLQENGADRRKLLEKARFFVRKDIGPVQPVLRELQLSDREDRWRWTSSRLAFLATSHWPDVDVPADQLRFLTGKRDAYFRYHELNKGTNDHWEYYLVPWHRTYGRLSIAMLDPRLRPVLFPIWKRFDRWHRTEKPWMTRFTVGSNISSVLTGYTLHALLGFLLHDSERDRRSSLDGYVRYAEKLHKALAGSYDGKARVAVPFEGVLYGSFWWRSAVVLALVQRALGLSYCLFDEPACRTLSEYVWHSRTPDGDYQTSGDSKALRAGVVPEDNVFPILSAVYDDPFADRLADLMSVPYFLRDRIRPSK